MDSSDDIEPDRGEPSSENDDTVPRSYLDDWKRFRFSPETRLRLSTSLSKIVAVCLLVAVVGGYGVYIGYSEPETTTEQSTIGNWVVDTVFEHSGVVQEDTATFTAGQRLDDRQLYFSRLTPTLEGAHVMYYRGDTETATATSELRLVVRAVETDGEVTTVHWQESEQLATTEINDLEPGERQRTPFAVDTVGAAERIDEIQSELGATPGQPEAVIIANTVIEATVEGERHVDEREDRLQLTPSISITDEADGTRTVSGFYRPTASVTGPATYETTRTTEVVNEPSPVAQAGGPVLLVLGLLGALATVGLRSIGALNLTPVERQRLTVEAERADAEEWISRGTPLAEPDRRVELDSLAGLVGVAIDSNRRVIEIDEAPLRYVVIVDDVGYVFEPPTVLEDSAERLPDEEREPATAGERFNSGDEADDGTAPEAEEALFKKADE